MTSREFRERLLKRARKADVTIEPPLLEPLESYVRLLARWNEKINLTALPLREPSDAALDRLLIEPLAAARFVPKLALKWFDLGSGGGSPALPLKLARPEARLTMVEAKTRKAAFLREAIRTLGLEGADVENARFESFADRPALRQTVDLVTVRAVRVDKSLVHATDALLAPAGQLLLFAAESGTRTAGPLTVIQTARLTPGGPTELILLQRRR